MHRKRGFTLTELIVVMVIVGILASVSIPMMRANTERAMLTEAIAAMGIIFSAQRAYFAEHGSYYGFSDWLTGWFGDTAVPGHLTRQDLDGTYFDSANFAVLDGAGEDVGLIVAFRVYTSESNAPQRGKVESVWGTEERYLHMWVNGVITQENLPTSGYPEYAGRGDPTVLPLPPD